MSPSTHCSSCQRSFDTILAKKVHEQHVHIFVFKCDYCETKFASERNLSKHMSKCNEKPKNYQIGVAKHPASDEKLKSVEKYAERKRKANTQVEQYAELLNDMKQKAARKDTEVVSNGGELKTNKSVEIDPLKNEKNLKKMFLENVLKEAKMIAQTQGDKVKKTQSKSTEAKEEIFQKLLQKFEDCAAKKTLDSNPQIQDTSGEWNEKEAIKKKPAKAVVAFECSFCDSLFKSKEALAEHEAGHESQDNSDDDNDDVTTLLSKHPVENADTVCTNLEYEEAKRKAHLLPEIQKRERMLKEKLARVKQAALVKQKAEIKQRRIAIVQAAMKKRQLREDVLNAKLISSIPKVPQNPSKSTNCTTYEYQQMIEKANNLESIQKRYQSLQLKLERVKKQALLRQNHAIFEDGGNGKYINDVKMKFIEVFEKISKKIIKEEPKSPEKFEPEMDPNFQIKLEPEICIKEEPDEFIPEIQITKSDSTKLVSKMAELSQAEKLEKYKQLKAKLEKLTAQKEISNREKAEKERNLVKDVKVDTNSDANNIQEDKPANATPDVANSVVAKRMKARKAREETVREIHKRIEERKRVKEEEETAMKDLKSKEIEESKRVKEEEELALKEIKSRELLDDLRLEVEKATQEVEENDTKQRKKSRKELRKHLQDKIVMTVNEGSSNFISKESKLEKIKEMEEERENLQQKLEELKHKKLSLKEVKKTMKMRDCEEEMERKDSSEIHKEKTDCTIPNQIHTAVLEISKSTESDKPAKLDALDNSNLSDISNEELTTQTEELTTQTEELTTQTEELTTQTEELTTQTEEITTQTEEEPNEVKCASLEITKSEEPGKLDESDILDVEKEHLVSINLSEEITLLKEGEPHKVSTFNCLEKEDIEIENQIKMSNDDLKPTDDEAYALDITYDEYQSEDEVENDALEVTGEVDETNQWKKAKENIMDKEKINTPIVLDDIFISDDDDATTTKRMIQSWSSILAVDIKPGLASNLIRTMRASSILMFPQRRKMKISLTMLRKLVIKLYLNRKVLLCYLTAILYCLVRHCSVQRPQHQEGFCSWRKRRL
eukprot:GFUD01023676.1.p1 GENE.GFUD01023676.1~~GFUD01023676.1.p1  ORF type:complete len:1066 (+),score=335.64 GFUD01023676.1:53-3250(+)